MENKNRTRKPPSSLLSPSISSLLSTQTFKALLSTGEKRLVKMDDKIVILTRLQARGRGDKMVIINISIYLMRLSGLRIKKKWRGEWAEVLRRVEKTT